MGCDNNNQKERSEKVFEQCLLDAVQAKAVDNRLTCAEARALAKELGIAISDLGEIANQLGIKIKNCQLGCF